MGLGIFVVGYTILTAVPHRASADDDKQREIERNESDKFLLSILVDSYIHARDTKLELDMEKACGGSPEKTARLQQEYRRWQTTIEVGIDTLVSKFGDEQDKAVGREWLAEREAQRERYAQDSNGANGAKAQAEAATNSARALENIDKRFRDSTATAREKFRALIAKNARARPNKAPQEGCPAKKETKEPGAANAILADQKKTNTPVPAGGQAIERPVGLDACLVGTWRSQSVAILGNGEGGVGIVMTIQKDGSLSIDYSGMSPLRSFGSTDFLSGKASGHIVASNGKSAVESVESSSLTHTNKGPLGTRTNAVGKTLAYGAPGDDPSGNYACNKDTLTIKGSPYTVTYQRQK
jgi:hypothetical protein